MIEKFENFQKKCIKWILSEEEFCYESYAIYVRKCQQIKLLPLAQRFILNDLIWFHKAVYSIIPLDIPYYLTLYKGYSRLRSSHLDELSFVSSVMPNNSSSITSNLEKSFFYRTHMIWNALPIELRSLESISEFRSKVEAHLWKDILKKDEEGPGELSDN